ncbi:MAG: cation:proton antiporter [Cyanobacteria bacterium J06621_12]
MLSALDKITIAWIAIPFLLGFIVYLLPRFARWFAFAISIISLSYAIAIFWLNSTLNIQLLDNFGVSLTVDSLSAWFVLTNALVTMAVILYCWQTGKTAFFYMQLVILHGSVNATFICTDFISLYVALEVISIAAFLLIAYPRSDRSIWVGLRYLFMSNTAMLFYLIGTVLVYQANNSFNYSGLLNAPVEAIALVILGLLGKGGIFVSGFWLPLTHSESETPVSAMLSGVVVKAGVFPLVRLALMLEAINPIVRLFGVATALLGVIFAIWEQDTKRTLAFSTISQLGFILAAPVVSGFYALTHGLAKSALFLVAGQLPSRRFAELRQLKVKNQIGIALLIPCLSISGFPLVSGFVAKTLTVDSLLSWQRVWMIAVTVGTAIVFAKFIFVIDFTSIFTASTAKHLNSTFWWAMLILQGGLVAANGFYVQAYTFSNLIKPLATIATGWLIYLFVIKRILIKLPRASERFEHLIGVMSLTLILLFWTVWTRIQFSA